MTFKTVNTKEEAASLCACCGKPIKKAFIYEGKAYGLDCLADMLGCTKSTVKKLYA